MPKTTSWEEVDVEEEVDSISLSVGEVESNTPEVLPTPRKSTVYFGYHGQTVARDPWDSGTLLADRTDKQPQRLTVQDLASTSLPDATLAYLSA